MHSAAKEINKKIKDHPEVLPYNDLNNVDINFEKLVDIAQNYSEIEKKRYYDNPNLMTEKNVVKLLEGMLFIFAYLIITNR